MSNLLTAEVTVEGTRPLLWHKFGPEALDASRKERTGSAGNDPEEWRRTVLVSREGQLYLAPDYIFAALREGAKYLKHNRRSMQPSVSATLQVNTECILVDRWFPGFPDSQPFNLQTVAAPPVDPGLPVYLDVRGVRNPATKGRNVRYRIAASPGWQCAFSLQWDKTIINREQMHTILIDTGKLVGLGNGRSIGFGRYDVLIFEVQ